MDNVARLMKNCKSHMIDILDEYECNNKYNRHAIITQVYILADQVKVN